MQRFRVFTDSNHAQMVEGVLKSHGLKTLLSGSKEYVSIIAGGTAGRYELLLEPEDFLKAQEILAAYDKASSEVEPLEPNYFNRALMQSFFAIILVPVIFNIASLLSAAKFWASSSKDATAVLKVLLIILMQIPSFFVLRFLVDSFDYFN